MWFTIILTIVAVAAFAYIAWKHDMSAAVAAFVSLAAAIAAALHQFAGSF